MFKDNNVFNELLHIHRTLEIFWFWLNVNKHVAFEVTMDFFVNKGDKDLFLALTNCSDSQKRIIKND